MIVGMIFQPAARYPADPRAVFILVMSVFGGLTSLLFKAEPGTLAHTLPHWGVMLWGSLLVLGSVTTLVGVAIQTYNGVIIEQVGSALVGVTTVYYAVLAFALNGVDAAQPVGIILAWGLACFIRYAQLQYLIKLKLKIKDLES